MENGHPLADNGEKFILATVYARDIKTHLENAIRVPNSIGPTGPKELELVAESGYLKWPPRLPEQPIFYPITNEQYAIEIASQWNVRESGSGYVTRFEVLKSFMDNYEIHQGGAAYHTEWWIPAEELDDLNKQIVGKIKVVGTYIA